jgi:hypothetical protein
MPLETEKVDLTDYYTAAQIDQLLQLHVTVADFNNALLLKANKANAAFTGDNPTINGAKLLSAADVIDNLTSEDTGKPLSARQGKILNEKAVSFDPDTMRYKGTWSAGVTYAKGDMVRRLYGGAVYRYFLSLVDNNNNALPNFIGSNASWEDINAFANQAYSVSYAPEPVHERTSAKSIVGQPKNASGMEVNNTLYDVYADEQRRLNDSRGLVASMADIPTDTGGGTTAETEVVDKTTESVLGELSSAATQADINAENATAIQGKAPINHASAENVYGVAAATKYGHVKCFTSTAFGITTLSAAINFNSVTYNGFFCVTGTFTNGPAEITETTLFVENQAFGTYYVQLVTEPISKKAWTRIMVSNVWSAWERQPKMSDIPQKDTELLTEPLVMAASMLSPETPYLYIEVPNAETVQQGDTIEIEYTFEYFGYASALTEGTTLSNGTYKLPLRHKYFSLPISVFSVPTPDVCAGEYKLFYLPCGTPEFAPANGVFFWNFNDLVWPAYPDIPHPPGLYMFLQGTDGMTPFEFVDFQGNVVNSHIKVTIESIKLKKGA